MRCDHKDVRGNRCEEEAIEECEFCGGELCEEHLDEHLDEEA